MSLANWFFPFVMVWLVTMGGPAKMSHTSSGREQWTILLDTLFLLPWILVLFLDDALASWMGLELLALLLVFDLLWRKPRENLQEAWVKVSLSWFLAWLFIGTAIALSGLQSIPESLFYPLSDLDVGRIRPVLAGFMFLVGLCIKLGVPPFQQGVIDLMEVLEFEDHRRWALQLRWCIVYSTWHAMPLLLGPLHFENQKLFAIVLILGCVAACMVSSVQASVQRTLAYLSTPLILLPVLGFLLIDPQLGMENSYSFCIWILTIFGFLSLALIYQAWPSSYPKSQVLLWSDMSSSAFSSWSKRLRLFSVWAILTFTGLGVYTALHKFWLLSMLLLVLALAFVSASTLQLGIVNWNRQRYKP